MKTREVIFHVGYHDKSLPAEQIKDDSNEKIPNKLSQQLRETFVGESECTIL